MGAGGGMCLTEFWLETTERDHSGGKKGLPPSIINEGQPDVRGGEKMLRIKGRTGGERSPTGRNADR